MQPSKPLPYCSHDMSSRGIPPLQASVLQSFGKSVSFADDVQVLQTQVNRKLMPVCGCLRCNCTNDTSCDAAVLSMEIAQLVVLACYFARSSQCITGTAL
jgi:hypothetical protein